MSISPSNPYIISSYPRSGSTWLRFILCNLIHSPPTAEGHDFASVNRCIPPIDHPEGLMEGIQYPFFYKTHGKPTATNIIYLHRHVGDVLISEWYYKRKMWDEKRTLEQYIGATGYGQEWRENVDWHYPARINVRYEEIGNPSVIYSIVGGAYGIQCCRTAIAASTFMKMREKEKYGMGIYPTGDESMHFCRKGMTGGWKTELHSDTIEQLLAHNQTQLKLLGYA